jgi:hypothetical protein
MCKCCKWFAWKKLPAGEDHQNIKNHPGSSRFPLFPLKHVGFSI